MIIIKINLRQAVFVHCHPTWISPPDDVHQSQQSVRNFKRMKGVTSSALAPGFSRYYRCHL